MDGGNGGGADEERKVGKLKTHSSEICSPLYIQVKKLFTVSIIQQIKLAFLNYIFTIVCHHLLLTVNSQYILYHLWGFVSFILLSDLKIRQLIWLDNLIDSSLLLESHRLSLGELQEIVLVSI